MNGFCTSDAAYNATVVQVINLSPLTLNIEEDDESLTQRPKSALQTVGMTWYLEKRKSSYSTSLTFQPY